MVMREATYSLIIMVWFGLCVLMYIVRFTINVDSMFIYMFYVLLCFISSEQELWCLSWSNNAHQHPLFQIFKFGAKKGSLRDRYVLLSLLQNSLFQDFQQYTWKRDHTWSGFKGSQLKCASVSLFFWWFPKQSVAHAKHCKILSTCDLGTKILWESSLWLHLAWSWVA